MAISMALSLNDFGKAVVAAELVSADELRALFASATANSPVSDSVAFAKLQIGVSGKFRYLLIDGQGVLLGVPRQRFDFPVLTGLTEEQTEADRHTRVVAMQQLLRQLGTGANGMVAEINAASPQDLRVAAKIGGHHVELWLGDRNYLARFQNFNNHFDEILRQADGASVFDLRLDDRIMTVR